MINSIKGTVLNLRQQESCFVVALEAASGVGFNLKISSFTAKDCEALGREMRLFAHLVVRENAFELFGFSKEAEKNLFKLLISVSGVGPSFAISVLNKISHFDLVGLIASGNEEALCCCKGVGKKTASRIVLELKSKIGKFGFEGPGFEKIETGSRENFDEAVNALIALGYEKSKAKKAIYSQAEQGKNCSVECLIKNALKVLF